MKTESRLESLRRLFTENGLVGEDAYKDPRGFVIITRTGIEKIQVNYQMVVSLEISYIRRDMVVVKATATATMPDGTESIIETFGEASQDNIKNAFPVAMAEKRALSRAVLKLSGFYRQGAYSEDEFDKSTSNGQLTH